MYTREVGGDLNFQLLYKRIDFRISLTADLYTNLMYLSLIVGRRTLGWMCYLHCLDVCKYSVPVKHLSRTTNDRLTGSPFGLASLIPWNHLKYNWTIQNRIWNKKNLIQVLLTKIKIKRTEFKKKYILPVHTGKNLPHTINIIKPNKCLYLVLLLN